MNVATHQEKDNNERTGKGEVGEERKQTTEFKETACCPSTVVHGGCTAKNSLCEGSAQSNWVPREGQQPFRPDPNEVGDRIITWRWLLVSDWSELSAY